MPSPPAPPTTSPPDAEDPFLLSDEVVEAVAALRPVTATFWGVAGHDGEWDDLRPEGHERARAALASFEARAATAAAGAARDGDPWRRLAADVLVDFLRVELGRYTHRDHLTDLNTLASPLQLLTMAFDVMPSGTPEAWEARASRLEGLPAALEGYRATLALGLASGEVVAARQVRAVLAQCAVHAGHASFVRSLGRQLAESKLDDPSLSARVEAAIPRVCDAFAAFPAWLGETYLPGAREADGVGRARYAREAQRFLGMSIDPEETYAWGWREIAALRERLGEAAARLSPAESVAEVLERLKAAPDYAAPSLEVFLERMRARQREALDQLGGVHFDVPAPVRTLDVKAAPPGGPIGVYYTAPSEGFARPGCVWYSLGDAAASGPVPMFDHVATAYHEGFPGHHLQIGIQLSLTDRLSRLHRVAEGYSGYAEGWALYAEELMAELGYYERPEYLVGMLSCQMIRACRIVLDIGAHLALPIPEGQPFHPGEAWTFELGVEMLTELGGLLPDRAASEMVRYLGWPGQAIAYKVGQRVFLELRDAERARLGAAFDPKAFHAKVLGSGNVGLDRLCRGVTGARP